MANWASPMCTFQFPKLHSSTLCEQDSLERPLGKCPLFGAGEAARSANCFLCKIEDPSSIPSTHSQVWHMLVIPQLGRKHVDLRSLLTRQSSRITEFWANERHSQRNKADSAWRQLSRADLWAQQKHFCTRSHNHMHTQPLEQTFPYT